MKRRILIIDDSETERFIVTSVLDRVPGEKIVLVFESGRKALDFLRDNLESCTEYDTVILLDINMPVMDGFQFIEKYKQMPAWIRNYISIFMLSSSNSDHDKQSAINTGVVSDFIVKPFTRAKAEMINAIKKEG